MSISINVIRDIPLSYGDAFYILDTNQFVHNFKELKDDFSRIYPHFNIAYSYKTNYIPRLCHIVDDLGGYAETVSEMEVELALKCGVRPENIIWNGPIKNEDYLQQYLPMGVVVNIDSVQEAECIKKLALSSHDTFNVGIRCNFDVQDGIISRFGLDVDSEDFYRVWDIISSAENIHFVNFQCHFAKRQIEYWPYRVEGMLQLVDRMGMIPKRIDLGGGMFGKMEDTLKKQFSSSIPQYIDYAKAVASVFANYFSNKSVKPELIIEPGSALVGDCMNFVGTVKTIKKVRGKYFATVIGSQKNINMASVNPPMELISMGQSSFEYKDIDFVGYTCIEGDVLYRGYSGNIAIGDRVVIRNCGSYSIVMKPPFILPNFPVYEYSNGAIRKIKRAEVFNDIFDTYEI